ncbi:MAG TPA: porin family protein [Ignavibacteria bacterium]|nr:porin family protein [Ignavibacteria bacterium]HMQ99607.1 porin family protein [Ignavibacteria bacterium]
MKLKTILLAAILAISTITVYSQPSLSIGLEGGLNLANVSITPSQTSNSRTGLIIGGVLDIGISRNIGVSTGLRFTMKGFQITNGGATFTDKLNYLEVPALLKVKFPLTEVKPYLVGGPVLGIRVSASEEQSNGTQTADVDASSAYETIDFGLLFGGGLDFNVANKTDLFIQAGYGFGLSNIWKQTTTVTVKNYGIQITGGVKFKL